MRCRENIQVPLSECVNCICDPEEECTCDKQPKGFDLCGDCEDILNMETEMTERTEKERCESAMKIYHIMGDGFIKMTERRKGDCLLVRDLEYGSHVITKPWNNKDGYNAMREIEDWMATQYVEGYYGKYLDNLAGGHFVTLPPANFWKAMRATAEQCFDAACRVLLDPEVDDE